MANPKVKAHGVVVLKGLEKALSNMDDIKNTYASLSELHSEKLQVDPGNFRVSNYSSYTSFLHFFTHFELSCSLKCSLRNQIGSSTALYF